jgi:hypothetical protein
VKALKGWCSADSASGSEVTGGEGGGGDGQTDAREETRGAAALDPRTSTKQIRGRERYCAVNLNLVRCKVRGSRRGMAIVRKCGTS